MSTPTKQLLEGNFVSVFTQIIHPAAVARLAREHRRSAAGATASMSPFRLVAAMVFHLLQPCGLLSAHVRQTGGPRRSDSSLSERRQGMGLPFFQALLELILKPLAQTQSHSHAFYKGFRLVGIDGSQWSVGNAPPIKERARKVRSRRGASAFLKLGMTALYELGTHTPLAARIGIKRESEMELAVPLFSMIPSDGLLIGDRYYGTAKCIHTLLSLASPVTFMLRVRKNLKCKRIEMLKDGSCLVSVRDRTSGKTTLIREIRARVCRQGGRWVSVRLWTNLLDDAAYPAMELLPLYGMRWEQECAYQELKINLRRNPLLLSHTLVTAGQEIACLILAQAVVARVRLSAAGTRIPVLQISFIKTLDVVRSFWSLIPMFEDLISDANIPVLARRLLDVLAQQASPPRRARSCPRAIRQPVSSWPRLRRNSSSTGAFQFKITRKAS